MIILVEWLLILILEQIDRDTIGDPLGNVIIVDMDLVHNHLLECRRMLRPDQIYIWSFFFSVDVQDTKCSFLILCSFEVDETSVRSFQFFLWKLVLFVYDDISK